VGILDIITDEFVSFKYSLRYRPGFSYYKIHWHVTFYYERGGWPRGVDGYARSVNQAIRKIHKAAANWGLGEIE